jgi:dienelactone hydrolase
VVAGVISRGADRGAYRLSVADVAAMMADLRFALDNVRRLPFVDASRVGIIGMSNGAFAAVGLANQTRIDAIVSLDGTVGERAAARVLPELPSAATPVSVPPLLHLYAPDNAYLDFAELRKRPGDCFTVRVPAVAHADFLTFARLRPVDPNAAHRRERVLEKFSSILRLTREFLGSRGAAARDGRLDPEDRALGLTAAPCSAP